MAWYEGTYLCGHKGKVNIVGKESDRKWKVDWHFGSACEECRKKKREEERKEVLKTAVEYGMPELISGTERQILWANEIRIEFFDYWTKRDVVVDDIINNELNSKFWIDNRMDIFHKSFLRGYQKEKIVEENNQRMISEDTVKPKEVKHDGVVEIIEANNAICLLYEKNDSFIALAKSMKYKWNGREWARELKETVGSFEDRAAEIGHELLQAGFCICIHDKQITDKAIKGEYQKEHTRWICSRNNTPFLAINWSEKNEDLYKKARKLKESRWNNPSVIINVSHYKDVENFAIENNFQFTKSAIEKIDNYIAEFNNVKEV